MQDLVFSEQRLRSEDGSGSEHTIDGQNFVAEVGKAPYIGQIHRKSHHRQQKIEFTAGGGKKRGGQNILLFFVRNKTAKQSRIGTSIKA